MSERLNNPNTDGLTRAEAWKLLDAYQDQWVAGHQRHGNTLDKQAGLIETCFEKIRLLETRVHDIEGREEVAENTVTKRNMIASGAISAIIGPLMAWLLRRFFML